MSRIISGGMSCGLIACALAAGSCSPMKRPVLYPNAALQSVGPKVAQQDIDDCLHLAEAHGVTPKREGEVAEQTVERGATGAAVGTAVGAVAGEVGRGAAAGAAGGATHGLVTGIFDSNEPDPIFRRFVEQCLRDKGYDVIGWQ